ncbi:membrane-bound PQQ-dependent dehydrogenase, glucose/quinate/shikimate family [Pseudomonas sp. RIT-PI-AD]|uniref:membrane-bound PQQ-dependent dehydrogenase, glucose/quinate/shikimate family n=1 Tax=Pseudomonas sp. RIT-PI-AD TaxID=3035294 RepID=UPI0021DAC032|nr:membrane-bound PQQ-dependent dehydrogenase, glucose/quinate/shikimate family [Pseudomonas sp. RIT-PI-AD]
MPIYSRSRPVFSGWLFLLLGALLILGGIWLLILGGSLYYLCAGVSLALTGGLLIRGQRQALWLYGAFWLATLGWSLWEVGTDVWQLEPRLMLPTLMGLYLLLPSLRRKLDGAGRPSPWGALAVPLVAVLLVLALLFAHPRSQPAADLAQVAAPVADGVAQADWQYYGRTPRGERWSPLDQITPDNVARLENVWTYQTGDLAKSGENQHGYEFNFEVTPIKVGDSLYICTPHSQVIALDADTGQERWRFDPKPETSNNAYLACRGVSYYEAPAGTPCRQRIIAPVADARLMALDAHTGQLCEGFGDKGFVSLRKHLGEVPKGFHFVTSPPLVAQDRVILGGWIYDGQKTHEPSGAVRAFDPVSGEIAWAWDIGRADSPVVHPAADETFTAGTPNAWGVYTADVERGLVYLPTGNAVPDYYGAKRRPFDERYSSSVVALDIRTGAPRWTFQTLHHDLWDMDVPIGPTLVDLPGEQGASVPALLQTTKRGELFLLNRETGQPLAEVAERPAPQGGLPGEPVAATQPYSVGMPSFAPPPIRESDAWGVTPFDQMLCRIEFRRMNYQGAYTPFVLERKTLVYPAFDGVIDWHGASLDPLHRRLYANLSYIPFTARVYARQDAEAEGLVEPWNGRGTPPRPKDFSINPQYGTPYVVKVEPWLGLFQAPCKAPPWGQLAAVDLDNRQLAWRHDVGTTRDTGPFGLHLNLPFPTGIFNIGGNINTRSGLIFMGATADDYLRAFEASSGRELWKTRLPAGGQATPMTYLGRDGRQYVVIAAGGHGGLQTRSGDYLKAYALPAKAR